MSSVPLIFEQIIHNEIILEFKSLMSEVVGLVDVTLLLLPTHLPLFW